MNKLFFARPFPLSIYQSQYCFAHLITKELFVIRNIRNFSCFSEPDDKVTTSSCINVNGQMITVSQHYFNKPIAQPRAPKGHRRVADLTGLKGGLNLIPRGILIQR